MCIIKWERPDRLVELMGSLPSLSNGSPWALGVEIWHRNIDLCLMVPIEFVGYCYLWICKPLEKDWIGEVLSKKNNTSDACTCCIPSWCFLVAHWCGSGHYTRLPGLQTRLWNTAQSLLFGLPKLGAFCIFLPGCALLSEPQSAQANFLVIISASKAFSHVKLQQRERKRARTLFWTHSMHSMHSHKLC